MRGCGGWGGGGSRSCAERLRREKRQRPLGSRSRLVFVWADQLSKTKLGMQVVSDPLVVTYS